MQLGAEPTVTRKSSDANLRRHQRVIDPLVARGSLIELRAERPLVGIALGALIDDRALLARERRLLVVALEEVLADLGPDELEQEAQVADQRIVAQHRPLRCSKSRSPSSASTSTASAKTAPSPVCAQRKPNQSASTIASVHAR